MTLLAPARHMQPPVAPAPGDPGMSRPNRPWSIGTPRVLAGIAASAGGESPVAALDYATHQTVHGPLPAVGLTRLLDLLDDAALLGRGGAGFPFATKLRALPDRRARQVVVNGCESEPGSAKDRMLLLANPHLVLDGAFAVARATGAHRVTVAVHDPALAARVTRAIQARPDGAGAHVRMIRGGFVAGEGRALLRAVHGGPAIPPGRRIHATERGVVLSNTETFAQIAVLIRLGAAYRKTGTSQEPGTALITVGGAVARPGVVEIPLGTPLTVLLQAIGAEPAQAVVLGGYHGTWHRPVDDARLSRAGLAEIGGSFGAGLVLVLDHRTCALGELARVAEWLAAESAGQCGPCRFGLPALARDVALLWHGRREARIGAARHADAANGRGACRHPDGAVRFVTSGLGLLSDEIDLHMRGGCGRPVLCELPVGGPQ